MRRDVGFYIKLYPLDIHKDAYRKSRTIQCERSLKLLENAFKVEKIPDPQCNTDVIDKNIRLARKLAITGAPTLIFDDGRVLTGVIEAKKIIDYIDRKN